MEPARVIVPGLIILTEMIADNVPTSTTTPARAAQKSIDGWFGVRIVFRGGNGGGAFGGG